MSKIKKVEQVVLLAFFILMSICAAGSCAAWGTSFWLEPSDGQVYKYANPTSQPPEEQSLYDQFFGNP